MQTLEQLKSERSRLLAESRKLVDQGETGGKFDKTRFDDLMRQVDEVRLKIEEREYIDKRAIRMGGTSQPTTSSEPLGLNGGGVRSFRPDESIRAATAAPEDPELRDATVGAAVLAKIRGESRAQQMGQDTTGGFFLSPAVSANFIDKTRASPVLSRSGVSTITFDRPETDSMSFVTLDTDPSPIWRAETVEITESTAEFGQVVSRPRVVGVLIKISEELAMSSPNARSTIDDALSAAMAQEIDRAGLLGAGGNEPVGLVNWPGIQTTAFAGTAPGADDLLDWGAAIEEVNGPGMALLSMAMPPALYSDIRKLKDGEGQYLIESMPEDFRRMRKLRSNQLRTDRGGGSAAEAIVYDPASVAIVTRSRMKVEVGHVASDFAKLMISIRAWMMTDVVVFRANHVHWIDNILV